MQTISEGNMPLQIGQEAPDFTAPTNSGRTVTLSDFRV